MSVARAPITIRSDPGTLLFATIQMLATWTNSTQKRLTDWGFNTVGGWSARDMTAGPMPYTIVLHLGRELGVPWMDVLDPHFADRVAAITAREVTPRADDPQLIGWYTDNELGWFADTLFAFHIAQPPESATRQALVKLLRRRYADDFSRLQQDFVATDANNFEELDNGGKLYFRQGGHGLLVADDFLRLVAEHFYQTAQAAIRRYDKNHLILGDRYQGYCPDPVAEAAGPYVDVVSTNFDQPDWTDGGLPAFYLSRLHQLSHRPVLVTEYYVAAQENRSGNKNTGNIFTTVATQHQRAEAVRKRLSSFAAMPYVVGAHWFQFYDEPTHGREDGEDYNFGLVDIEDKPYEELVTAFKETNADVPRLHAAAGLAEPKKDGQPIGVPAASADPLSGIASWDQSRGLVTCTESSSLADLLASWDSHHVYLALGCSAYVDSGAYSEKDAAKRDRLVWRLALADGPPVDVEFGVGSEMVVSDEKVSDQLHQRGMRYTAIIAVPVEQFGRENLHAGDQVRLVASLQDPRRDTKTTWDRQLELGVSLHEALSQQEHEAR